MEGKPNEFVLESLNFADDVVQGSTVKREPYSKLGWTDCLYIWIMVDGLGPHFWLTSEFNRRCSYPECPQSVYGK